MEQNNNEDNELILSYFILKAVRRFIYSLISETLCICWNTERRCIVTRSGETSRQKTNVHVCIMRVSLKMTFSVWKSLTCRMGSERIDRLVVSVLDLSTICNICKSSARGKSRGEEGNNPHALSMGHFKHALSVKHWHAVAN